MATKTKKKVTSTKAKTVRKPDPLDEDVGDDELEEEEAPAPKESSKKKASKLSTKKTLSATRRARASESRKKGPKVEVRATRMGYYGNKLRKPGEVFVMRPHGEDLPSWVQGADEPYTPEVADEGPQGRKKIERVASHPDADDGDVL